MVLVTRFCWVQHSGFTADYRVTNMFVVHPLYSYSKLLPQIEPKMVLVVMRALQWTFGILSFMQQATSSRPYPDPCNKSLQEPLCVGLCELQSLSRCVGVTMV